MGVTSVKLKENLCAFAALQTIFLDNPRWGAAWLNHCRRLVPDQSILLDFEIDNPIVCPTKLSPGIINTLQKPMFRYILLRAKNYPFSRMHYAVVDKEYIIKHIVSFYDPYGWEVDGNSNVSLTLTKGESFMLIGSFDLDPIFFDSIKSTPSSKWIGENLCSFI